MAATSGGVVITYKISGRKCGGGLYVMEKGRPLAFGQVCHVVDDCIADDPLVLIGIVKDAPISLERIVQQPQSLTSTCKPIFLGFPGFAQPIFIWLSAAASRSQRRQSAWLAGVTARGKGKIFFHVYPPEPRQIRNPDPAHLMQVQWSRFVATEIHPI